MKFKPETTEETIQSIFNAYRAAADEKKIPGLTCLSIGIYSSPEGMNKGFTHAVTMIFEDELSRDNMFSHAEHLRVKDIIMPNLDDFIGFEYAL
jgi:Stress responsive A/B Barrel Domain